MNIISTTTFLYTALALLAFAANSVLCRMALSGGSIDASSFTLIRLISGAAFLIMLIGLRKTNRSAQSKGAWLPALMLFVYAITFSFGYIALETGTGALILFGSVQMTMLLGSIFSGNRLSAIEWLGIGIAFFGFVYLIIPNIGTPSAGGFLLMACSGIAWGCYSILGKNSKDPLADTAYNFLRTLPFCAVVLIFTISTSYLSMQGVMLAIASGALASGVGYSIWYLALRTLDPTQASVVQLLVPVLAAFGGLLLADELITLRLIESSCLVLGGIFMVILGKKYNAHKQGT